MKSEEEIIDEIKMCEKEIESIEKEYANFLIPKNIFNIWTNHYKEKIKVLKWVVDK